MTVSRIGLATSTTGWYNTNELDITSTRSAIYVGWSAEYPHEGDTFNLSIRYRGIGVDSPAIFPDWSGWTNISVPCSQASEHFNSYYNDYWYAVDISKFGLNAALNGNKGWDINNRTYDYIEFEIGVGVRMDEAPEWNNFSDTIAPVYGTTAISYVPDYQIVDLIAGSLEEYKIIMNKPAAARSDDRWCLELIRPSSSWSNLTSYEDPWGTMDGDGNIWLPRSYLSRDLVDNQTYILNIRFNRAWLPIYGNLKTAVATIAYDADPQCNTPTIRVKSNSSDAIVFEVGDSGDLDHPIDTVRVSLRGSEYTSDSSTGPIGEHRLAAQPFGNNTYEVVGWNDTYGISKTVTISAYTKSAGNICVFTSADGNYSAEVQLNPNYSISVSPEVETYKLAGRPHPTSFSGYGTNTTIDVSGVLLNDSADGWLALARNNSNIVVRFPDGKRYMTVATNMSTDWTNRNIKNISFSGLEVS